MNKQLITQKLKEKNIRLTNKEFEGLIKFLELVNSVWSNIKIREIKEVCHGLINADRVWRIASKLDLIERKAPDQHIVQYRLKPQESKTSIISDSLLREIENIK